MREFLIVSLIIGLSLTGGWWFLTRDPYGSELDYDATFNARGVKWGVQRTEWIEFDDEWLLDVTVVPVSGQLNQIKVGELAKSICGGFLSSVSYRPAVGVKRSDVFRVNLQGKVISKTKTVEPMFDTIMPIAVEDGACLRPKGRVLFPNFPAPIEGWVIKKFEMKTRNDDSTLTLVFEADNAETAKQADRFAFRTACNYALRDPFVISRFQALSGEEDLPAKITVSARKSYGVSLLNFSTSRSMQFDAVDDQCMDQKASDA
ncbi:hypothetical protein [Planktotalea sp.]|uniref:hypothetical protein n=1 Tax=Planktotalea sp. TaxID=2029877 RepID=UPI003296B111